MPFEHLLKTVPTNTEVFCGVYDFAAGKADLIKGYWNLKRQLG